MLSVKRSKQSPIILAHNTCARICATNSSEKQQESQPISMSGVYLTEMNLSSVCSLGQRMLTHGSPMRRAKDNAFVDVRSLFPKKKN